MTVTGLAFCFVGAMIAVIAAIIVAAILLTSLHTVLIAGLVLLLAVPMGIGLCVKGP